MTCLFNHYRHKSKTSQPCPREPHKSISKPTPSPNGGDPVSFMTRSGSKSPSKKSYSPAKSKYPPRAEKARAEKWRSLCVKHASRIKMLAKATLSTPDDSLKGATPGPVAI